MTSKLGLTIAFATCIAASGAFAGTVAGGDLFREKCGGCHGRDGSGNTPMGKALKVRDLGSQDIQKQSGEALAHIITQGKGKMPAFDGRLKAEEVGELVSHIRTLAKKN